MSAATATETPTRVTARTTVQTEAPATTKPGGFMNWLRGVGRSIQRGWYRFWDGVKRFGSWTKTKAIAAAKAVGRSARRGGSALWRGVKWVGNKIYWSGAAVGRFIGRGARFFGRSTLTLARGTTRFLGRTLGWVLRSASFVVRSLMEATVVTALVFWVIVGLLVMFLAWGHDGYEQNVHRHAKAASRGEYRADKGTGIGALDAKKAVADMASAQAESVAHWNRDNTVVSTEEVPDLKHWSDWTSQERLEFWQIREPALPLPEKVTYDTILDIMSATLLYGEPPLPHTRQEYLINNPLPEAQSISDNDIWLGMSYWDGRMMATTAFASSTEEINLVQPWDAIVHQIKTRMGVGWTQENKRLGHLYADRTRHEHSMRKGWQDQTEFMVNWFEGARKDLLTAAQLEEAENPPPPAKKTAAKKATAKKTTSSA